jgi:hypothetical protein
LPNIHSAALLTSIQTLKTSWIFSIASGSDDDLRMMIAEYQCFVFELARRKFVILLEIRCHDISRDHDKSGDD